MAPPLMNVDFSQPQAAPLNDLRTCNTNMERPQDEIYHLQGGRGRCYVCQIDFTSTSHANQHLSGQKHKKCVAARQLSLNRPPHAAVLSAQNQPVSQALIPGGPISPVTANGQENTIQLHHNVSSPHSGVGENVMFQRSAPKRGPNGEEYILNGSRGTCFVCEVEFTSLEHAKSHLNGSKHKKKCGSPSEARVPNAGGSTEGIAYHLDSVGMPSNANGVYMCSACQVPFSCLSNAEEHFASTKHKNKVAKNEGNISHPTETMMRQDSHSSSFDQTCLKTVCDSPFVPLRTTSLESPVLGQGLIRPTSANAVDSNISSTVSDREGSHVPQVLQPVPMKAIQDTQFSGYTQQPVQYSSDEETVLKGCNTPKNVGISGGNLSANVAEISKVKHKDVFAPSLAQVQPATPQSISSEGSGSSITDNCQQKVLMRTNQLPAGLDVANRYSQEGRDQNLGYPIHGVGQNNFFANTETSQQLHQQQPQALTSPRPAYYFDSHLGRGFCNACNVELTSTQLADQHLNGQKHKKKMTYWENASQYQRLASPALHQPMASPALHQPMASPALHQPMASPALHQPMASPALHQPMLSPALHQPMASPALHQPMASPALHQPSASPALHQPSASPALHQPSVSPALPQPLASSTPVIHQTHPAAMTSQFSNQRSSPHAVVASPVILQQTPGADSPVQDSPDETCFFNGSRGFCVVCNIEITSPQHYDQHRLGKPHSRSRQRYLQSQQGISYPLYCDVCKKPFTGQESAQQHFTSARHKSKMEIFGSGGREVEKLEDGRMIMRDSQIWYICDICECPLNTREQFEIHKASPRHKKAVENKTNNAEMGMLTSQSRRSLDGEQKASVSVDIGENVQSTGPAMSLFLFEKENRGRESVLEANLQHLTFKPHAVTNSTMAHEVHPHQSTPGRASPWITAQSTSREATPTGAATPQPGAIENPLRLPTERYRIGTASHQGSQPTDFNSLQKHNFSSSSGSAHSASSTGTDSAGQCGSTGFAVACSTNENGMQSTARSQSTPGPDSVCERGSSGIARRPDFRRRTSNKANALPYRDISTMEQRHSSDEEWDNGFEDEDQEVERTNFNISGVEEDALTSQLEKVHISDTQHPARQVAERSMKQGFKYYCKICKRHMCTKESLEGHFAGKFHKYMVSTMPTPITRQLPPIRSEVTQGVCGRALELTKDIPRAYQIELLRKAMARDTVIYLPTGTGKTLVAVLTMGLMLQENETRPILFLVDKVLLVLQQEKYIREQFKGKKFKRPDVNKDDVLVERELLLNVICGGLFSKSEIPIWKHDIIVTTADFCMNMLDREWIRWNDFSLVVLDEVHHCHKSHPYLKLFDKHHKQWRQQHPIPVESIQSRNDQGRMHPKVLGLSASPASKDTVEQTHKKLKDLLANLGGAHVAMVEEEVEELDKYQSSAKVIPKCVHMSNNEKEFTLQLLEYSLMCYVQLANLCPALRDYKAPPYSYFMSAVNGTEEDITSTARLLMTDMEPLLEITNCIYAVQRPADLDNQLEQQNLFDNLRMHLQALLLFVRDIGSNSSIFINPLLKELSEPPEKIALFEKLSLPCADMYQKVKHFAEYGSKDMTMYSQLLQTLCNPAYIDWSDRTCKAMVLTQRRQEAKQLAQMLRDTDFVEERSLKVSHLVGHGKNAQDGGMDVKKQKKLLDNQERYHLLVATSIMEEGVDFQTLQLVVCMNPPTSVRALVQIRGRARRAGSCFVILCKMEEEKRKLEALLDQEQNMKRAVQLCLIEDRARQHEGSPYRK